jgi:hypothetical protein
MNKIAHQVLLGSLLGDGGISKNNPRCKNYCFKEMHGPAQREYVDWKSKQLACFGSIACGKVRPELFTWTRPMFTTLREEIYGEHTKKSFLPKHQFKDLNHLGLLVWYLNDGTWGKGQMTIRCELFNNADLEWITGHLNHKLKLDMKLYDYGYTRHVSLRAGSRDKVLPIWKKLFKQHSIPQSMAYKLGE